MHRARMVFWIFFVSEGAEAREEDARGMFRAKEKNSRCRVTECNRGMGDDCIGFCWIVVNRAGRTELMPNESEACVESGSGLWKKE